MDNQRSFTLVELLITASVGILVLTGVLMTIIHSMVLDEYNEKLSIAMNIARAELEVEFAKRTAFGSIETREGVLEQEVDNIEGAYRIEVTEPISGSLKNVKVLVCWQSRGRVWGECVWDVTDGKYKFSDLNKDGFLQAPVEIETAIANRGS